MASSLETFLQGVRQQIVGGEIELALEQLQNYLGDKSSNFQNEIILYLGRYKRLRQANRQGTITRGQFQAEINQLTQNILDFLEEISVKVQTQSLSIQFPHKTIPNTPSSSKTQVFDVFIAYNSKDKTEVEVIAGALKKYGIKYWLDTEQIPPGRWFQDVIQEAIPEVKTAAIFLGQYGLGRWQVSELLSGKARFQEVSNMFSFQLPEDDGRYKTVTRKMKKVTRPRHHSSVLDRLKEFLSSPKGNPDNFDVFLVYGDSEAFQVEKIANELKRRNLNPWLANERIPPGEWIQDEIQRAIQEVDSAAIFVGASGLKRWEIIQLRTFISRCIKSNVSVIPVLLPGVYEIPNDLLFLQEFNGVIFRSIDDVEAFDRLEWGITRKIPEKK